MQLKNYMKKKITILSGAGISAESGLKTFRDAGGLWEGYDVMEVASTEGWKKNPKLVMDFYNLRRRQLKDVQPNDAHKYCAYLEQYFDVTIVTQNVDNLHERAGSTNIIHLHGELNKVRSLKDENYVIEWEKDLFFGDLCPKGGQLRPHIVWFGEPVPKLEDAAIAVNDADYIIVVGSSMVVYPAAGLVYYARSHAEVFYIDPNPSLNYELERNKNLRVFAKTATEGMKIVNDYLISKI